MRLQQYSGNTFFVWAVAVLLLAVGSPRATGDGDLPDLDDLGTVDFPASCSPAVAADLSRAVALLHHMTYPQARETFLSVAEADPECAMAQWGFAMTLFQPVWPTRPGPRELELGWEAAQRARELEPPTERERLYVASVEAFFTDPSSTDYWERIRRWEGAMERLHAAFPEDPDAAALYALAHLATAPAGEVSLAHSERAATILLAVLERHPDHPGAMHYLIHANDAPGRERNSLDVVARYETVAPQNPHALHMPTHIYTRLGDWEAVIRGNLRAAEAALAHPAGGSGEFVWDEFPHAVEYLVYAYLQQGADADAAAAIARLRSTGPLQPTFKTAFHLASTAARHALERRDWIEAAATIPRQPAELAWDRYPWPEAIAWFARGLGRARTGEMATAREALDRLAAIEGATRERGEELFARNIEILRLELAAWIAHLDGDRPAAVEQMRRAADLEKSTPKHPVTPAPTLPALELLGDLLLAQERPHEALKAYRASLAAYPRRFNSTLGAARAAYAAGDSAAAAEHYAELLSIAAQGGRSELLDEARRRSGH